MQGRGCDRWTRRHVGLATIGLTELFVHRDDADAKKKRRRKRKKGPPFPAPSTCALACGSACAFCFHRAAGSLLCGEGSSVSCAEACTTDDQCLDPSRRYCMTRSEDPATGALLDLCLVPGGYCGQVNACEA